MLRGLLTLALLALLPAVIVAAEITADELAAQARQAVQAGQLPRGLELANKAVAADAKNLPALLLRAKIYQATANHAAAIADFTTALAVNPELAAIYQQRGVEHFKLGQVEASITDFDRYLKAYPDQEPHHWQRGISYYYAGRYDEGRKQFELHRTVNPQDVENSVWHFLCVARGTDAATALKQLIPIDRDGRVPMMEVFALFGGKATAAEVLAAANAGKPSEEELKERLFYAHLYLGLYFEAVGKPELAKEHIFIAADKYPSTHYMGDVARIHAARLRAKI